MKRDFGLDTLLNMDSFEFHYPNGYWYKIEARQVKADIHLPHGIRYALTLLNKYGIRIFGMDNKHRPKTKRKGYHGRIVEYDHIHNCEKDKGIPYTFINAEKLLTDFWTHVDHIMSNVEELS
jgi:hypothetical protein